MKIVVKKGNVCTNEIKGKIVDLQYEVMYKEQNNIWSYEHFNQDMQPLFNSQYTMIGYVI
jgi:hypothetical protein